MGGKFFIDKRGNNPCTRIPNTVVQKLTESVLAVIGRIFEKIEPVTSTETIPKKDHGDLDFVALANSNERENLRKFCDNTGIKHGSNGPMEHLLYPYQHYNNTEPGLCLYQIDIIFSGDEAGYETIKHFYSKPIFFNSVVGQFARSLGYIFSTKGFFLLVTDVRKQNRKILLTKDLCLAYKVLQLSSYTKDAERELFSTPESFANWVMNSPRFDTEAFKNSHNVNSHRDAKRELFCDVVYKILDSSGIKASIPFYKIDFSKDNLDLDKFLEFEIKILGEEIKSHVVEKIAEFKRVAEPIIRGDVIVEMGYPQGPLIGEIIQDVSKRFSSESSEEEIKEHILSNFQI